LTLALINDLKLTRDALPPCLPPIWAKTGHLQTIMGHLLPSPKVLEKGKVLNVTLERETERIHTTYIKGETNLVVYLFHGLGGSADATYMQRTALIARELGAHVFINNHRGCGQGAGLATEPYHSGRAEDLSKVIAFGRNMLPNHRHIAIGFSLSANALLLLAAKVRAEVLPDMAIAVNGPIHLDRASIKLTQGLNQIYDKRFVLELKHYIKRNRPQGVTTVGKIKDLREFDELYTAPIGGFKSRADYYATCSANQYLAQIAIPTVLLTAEDDPFVSPEDYKTSKLSENVILHIEKHGGHMGYLNRKGLGSERWLDLALRAYLKSASSFFMAAVTDSR
jgi:predicted alpha/beta-fold hydrolase